MGWLGTWAKRIKITIDAGDIDADLTDFPILVYISASSGINGEDISCVFDELTVDANRKKIAVTTSDGTTQCYVEIEKWDDANEKAWLWVKVPSIDDAVNTDLYLYYDDTQADNDTYVGDPESTPAMAVWDANFKMVQHLRDKTTSTTADSTTNNNDGTKTSANNPIVTTVGKIGDAQDFSDDCIDLAAGARLVTTSAFTVEFWFNADSTNEGSLISQRLTNGFFNYLFRWSNTANKMLFYVARTLLNSGLLNTGEWYHIAMVYDGVVTTTCYVNGVSAGTITGIPDYANTSIVRMGQDAGNTGIPYDGKMDETRISTVVRLISWVKATYETGRDHLLDWGTEENAAVDHYITVTEIIGALDSYSRSKTVHRTITEILGLQEVGRSFGCMELGSSFDVIENYIRGSVFTLTTTGKGVSITVGLRGEFEEWTGQVKCAIYLHSDLSLVTDGVTEGRTITLTLTPTWFTFQFPIKPSLTVSTAYILVVWAENQDYFAHIVYVTGDANQGHYQYEVFNGFPDPLVPDGHQSRKYSIYCTIDISSRIKSYYRTITEILGMLETKIIGGFRVKEVVVGEEDLSVEEGYEYDEVTYTATVLDSDANVLPASFMVDLIAVAGETVIVLIDDQLLTSGVYDQETGMLTLIFLVPHEHGSYTVELDWEEQTL